jgi:hypothetical protein
VYNWVLSLQELDDADLAWVNNSSPEFAAFVNRVKNMGSLNAMSAFNGIKIVMEFYTLVQSAPNKSAMTSTLKELFQRTQPLFKHGIRFGKTMMNTASGPNFRKGRPISNFYKNNAAVWNAAHLPHAPASGYSNGLQWSWSGHEWQDGGRRNRTRRGRSTARRSTARRSTARRSRSTARRSTRRG